jgi:hypothetical protein
VNRVRTTLPLVPGIECVAEPRAPRFVPFNINSSQSQRLLRSNCRLLIWTLIVALGELGLFTSAQGQSIRARDLGIPFEGIGGPLNAITDVPGVEVGHATLLKATGPWSRARVQFARA